MDFSPPSEPAKGFDASDVIYLLMPDRFTNGDPLDDSILGLHEKANRSDPNGRHGGDLKGHPDISSETKKAVRELVEKWNYKPDPIALSLKGGHGRTIGVIMPEIVHYFFSTVISGIEDIAYDSGYNVMFCQSNELYEREVKAVETLLSSRVDGILVSLSKHTADYDHFRKIMKAGIPLVFFNRICDEIETDRVIVDDEHGMKVPDDVSIVGFTSGMISDLTDSPLTSVLQHGYIVGKEAVSILISNLENRKETPFQTKVIKTELVIKGSTRNIL